MNTEPRFALVDPATDQILWVCSGATAQGACPTAEEPPYVCQGLKVVAAAGTSQDGRNLLVENMVPGHCPALAIA
jgi:hypothetical protein